MIYVKETIVVVMHCFYKLEYNRYLCLGNNTVTLLRVFQLAINLSTDMLINFKF